jgi:hypothetical protein
LERPEGKKGRASGDKEEGERGRAHGEGAAARDAAGTVADEPGWQPAGKQGRWERRKGEPNDLYCKDVWKAELLLEITFCGSFVKEQPSQRINFFKQKHKR